MTPRNIEDLVEQLRRPLFNTHAFSSRATIDTHTAALELRGHEAAVVYVTTSDDARHWRMTLAHCDRQDVVTPFTELAAFSLTDQGICLFFDTQAGAVQAAIEPITSREWFGLVVDHGVLVSGYKLYIFDADGTLRRCTVPGQPCPNRHGEWELLPWVYKLELPYDAEIAIASNQGGVALKHMSYETAISMLEDLWCQVSGRSSMPQHSPIAMCHHHPQAGCPCRKPKPSMLHTLMQRFGVSAAETIYIGDLESDRQAAEAAGVAFSWAKDFFDAEEA